MNDNYTVTDMLADAIKALIVVGLFAIVLSTSGSFAAVPI
ncbi:hypothetical protein GCM10017044_09740 [Kordiimonas sediminis]|uniref:Uncharacterized protein n=1 Tax=Kordiimonas sediminis TaxID=1735581 RepID=A0A919E3Z6_9PROT|nr:hypothetical protein GCM10017044_09740 [Kordiimonas sediminis]